MNETQSNAEIPGSARVSRVGFGVSPKQSLLQRHFTREVRDREDAITSTRDACATQSFAISGEEMMR